MPSCSARGPTPPSRPASRFFLLMTASARNAVSACFGRALQEGDGVFLPPPVPSPPPLTSVCLVKQKRHAESANPTASLCPGLPLTFVPYLEANKRGKQPRDRAPSHHPRDDGRPGKGSRDRGRWLRAGLARSSLSDLCPPCTTPFRSPARTRHRISQVISVAPVVHGVFFRRNFRKGGPI